MSSFLEKFEKKHYQTRQQYNDDLVINQEKREIKKHENYDSVTQYNHADDEIIEIDTSFRIKQKRKKIMIAVLSSLAVVVCLLIWLFLNTVAVPNLVNKKQVDVELWAKENNITVQLEKVYSKEQPVDHVIAQETTTGSYVFKGSTLKFTISKGADPSEYIPIPDFKTMNQREVEEWIAREKLTNTKIDAIYHQTIPANTFIEAQFDDKSVTNTTFKRKDILMIVISKGIKPIEKDINVLDFMNKPKEEVLTWSKTNQVEIQFKEVADDKIMEGNVVSQSVPANEKISTADKIEIALSQGKGIKVPDFSNITKTSATTISSELQVTVKEVYAHTGYGKFISQNVASGSVLTGENKKVEVTYSVGRPFVDHLVGKNLKELEQYFSEMNEKKANISYKIVYEASNDSSVVKGTVTRSSVSNAYIEFGGYVTVYIAK